MYIRLLSDLHLERNNRFQIVPLSTDNETILILAGDIGNISTPYTLFPFLKFCSCQFYKVLYVLGNHEFYGTTIDDGYLALKKQIEDFQLDNVSILNNSIHEEQDVVFIGSTLWSDFRNNDPLVVEDCKNNIWDYCQIGYNSESGHKIGLLPQHTYDIFQHSKKYIFEEIPKFKHKKVVVVTHHAPSYESVHEQFRTGSISLLNGAFVSELSNEILIHQPDMWFHGHTHNSINYTIGNTKVMSNTRGYVPFEKYTNFDPILLIQI